MLRVGFLGCTGRMGLQNMLYAIKQPDIVIGAAITSSKDPALGKDIGEILGLTENTNIKVSDNISKVINEIDVLIDFSSPKASLHALEYCVSANKPMVIATTGFTSEQEKKIYLAGHNIPVVYTANTSIGITVFAKILQSVSNKLFDDFDIDILETHHRNKVDLPSGTALFLGKQIAKEKNTELDKLSVYKSDDLKIPREDGKINFVSLRSGDIFGEHTVSFTNSDEKIEIKHTAMSRRLFSKGALLAAKWAQSCKKAGVYTMFDVLGLKN